MESSNPSIEDHFTRVVIECETEQTPQEKELLKEYLQHHPASIEERILFGVLIQGWEENPDSLEKSHSILLSTLEDAAEAHHRFWIHFHLAFLDLEIFHHLQETWPLRDVSPEHWLRLVYACENHSPVPTYQQWSFDLSDKIFSTGSGWLFKKGYELWKSDFPVRMLRETYAQAEEQEINLDDLTERFIFITDLRRLNQCHAIGDLVTELFSFHQETIRLTKRNIHSLCIIFSHLQQKDLLFQEHIHQCRLLTETVLEDKEYEPALQLLCQATKVQIVEDNPEESQILRTLIQEQEDIDISLFGDTLFLLSATPSSLMFAKKFFGHESLPVYTYINMMSGAIKYRDIPFALQCQELIMQAQEELLPNFQEVHILNTQLLNILQNPSSIALEEVVEKYKPIVVESDEDVLLEALHIFDAIFETMDVQNCWLHTIYSAILRKIGKEEGQRAEHHLEQALQYAQAEEEYFWVHVEYSRLFRQNDIPLLLNHIEKAAQYIHINPIRWCHQMWNASDKFPHMIPRLKHIFEQNRSTLESLSNQNERLWKELIDLQIILDIQNTKNHLLKLLQEYNLFHIDKQKAYDYIFANIIEIYSRDAGIFGATCQWFIEELNGLQYLDNTDVITLLCIFTDYAHNDQYSESFSILHTELDARSIDFPQDQFVINIYKAKFQYFYDDFPLFLRELRKNIESFMEEPPTEEGMNFIVNIFKEALFDIDVALDLAFWYLDWEPDPNPMVLVNIMPAFIGSGMLSDAFALIPKIESKKKSLPANFIQVYFLNKLNLEEIKGLNLFSEIEHLQLIQFLKNSPHLDYQSLYLIRIVKHHIRKENWNADLDSELDMFQKNKEKLPPLRVFQIYRQFGLYYWQSYQHEERDEKKRELAIHFLEKSLEVVSEEHPEMQLIPLKVLIEIKGPSHYDQLMGMMKNIEDIQRFQFLSIQEKIRPLSLADQKYVAVVHESIQEYSTAAKYWFQAAQLSTEDASTQWYLERALQLSTKLLKYLGSDPQKRNIFLNQSLEYVQTLVQFFLDRKQPQEALRTIHCFRSIESHHLNQQIQLRQETIKPTTQRLLDALIQRQFTSPIFEASNQLRNTRDLQLPMAEINMLGVAESSFWDSCTEFVATHLQEGELSLEMFALPDSLVVFTITSNHVGWYTVPWGENERNLIRHNILGHLDQPWVQLSSPRKLRNFAQDIKSIQKKLFPPIVINLIQRSTSFWIACSSSLLMLPFGLFKDGDQYWVETHMPKLLFSSSQLINRNTAPVQIKKALLLRGTDEYEGVLPLADAEINSIGQLLEQNHVDITSSTTENIDLLHYAGHASFDTNRQEGTIACQGFRLPSSHFATMNLNRAIVFLSACKSSQSSTQSNGITGFPRGIFAGGARSFIGTAWPTFDQASQRFACAFYDRVIQGTEPAKAVQESILELRISMPEIWHWANFRYFGY